MPTNDNNGTAGSAIVGTTITPGSGLAFQGNGSVTIPAIIGGKTVFSIRMAITTTSTQSRDSRGWYQPGFVGFLTSGYGNGDISIGISGGKLDLYEEITTTYCNTYAGTQTINDGKMHIVTVTCDGKNIYAYVDGVVDIKAENVTIVNPVKDNSMSIGYPDGVYTLFDLYDLSFFDRALTAAEANTLDHTDAIAWYECDSTSSFVDSSTHGNNGTITGALQVVPRIRYTNRGVRDVLLNSGDNAKAPENESKTGVEVQFADSSHSISLADIGFDDAKELWMRFDIFCRGGDGAVSFFCDDEETYGNRTTAKLFFGYAEIRKNIANPATTDYTYKLYTFRIHVTSQSLTVHKDDILQYTYHNPSLSSLPIKRIGIYPGYSFVSNIIIADYDCTQETLTAAEAVAATNHYDMARAAYSTEIEHADTSRTVTIEATEIPVANHYDTYRTSRLVETEHADISRETDVIWRYTNAGVNRNVNYAVKEVVCDSSKSVTGTAIVSNRANRNLFPIGDSKEIWIKFDAWIKSGSLKIHSDMYDETCGVVLYHKAAGTPNLEIGECSELHITSNSLSENGYMEDLTVDGYARYLIHMKANTGSAKDGIIELYVGNDKKTNHILDGLEEVNKGQAFTCLYFCTDDTTDNVLVSNIIISNRKVGIDEDVLVSASKHYDMHREATRTEVEHADLRRAASTNDEMTVTMHCDVDRLVRLHTPFDVVTHADVDRAIAMSMSVHADTYTLKKLAPWRYENPGTYNLLSESYGIDSMSHLNVTDPTCTKTRTGIAYAVPANIGGEMFDIPIDTEIWIKFDAWISPTEIAGTHRQIIAGSSVERHQTYFDFRVPLGDSSWCAENHNHFVEDLPDITGLHSYKMHILAGDAHGAMEIYIDDETKPYVTYSGKIQHTELLDDIIIGADTMDDDDMSASLISNVIISNQYIGIHEMVKDSKDHGIPAVSHGDIQRYTSAAVLNHEDISLTDYFKAACHEDIYRSVSTIETERADIARRILNNGQIPVTFHVDICRRTSQPFDSHADICRATKKHIRPHYDTQVERYRKDRFHYTTHNDFKVSKGNIINYHCDIARNKLLEIKPFREGYQDVQEIDISLNELTLSDSIKLTTTERLYLTEIVRGKLLDYDFQYAIESTSQRGIQTEAQLMQDCDALLYQQIMYNEEQTRTPSYIFDDDDLIGMTDREKQLAREAYEEDILWRKNQWKKDRKERSWAQSNMERISRALDRKLIYLADNFMSSNDWLGTGNTFSSIISALYGWTNRVPRMQINVFMRGGNLYVLQRGHELHLLDLTDSAHTVPEIDREIVRTAWTRTRDDSSSGNAAGDYVDGGGIEDYFSGSKTSGGMTYDYADGLLTQAQGTDSEGNTVWILYNYTQAGTYGDDAVVMTSKEEHIVSLQTGTAMLRQTFYSYGGGWCTAAEYEDGEFINSSEYQQSPVSRVTEFMPLMPGSLPGGGPGKKATLMVDRSFPIRSDDTVMLAKLTNELMWINRKTKETIKMDVYHCDHLVDFTDRIKFRGSEYYLVSNEVSQTQTELKQSLTMVRWY